MGKMSLLLCWETKEVKDNGAGIGELTVLWADGG